MEGGGVVFCVCLKQSGDGGFEEFAVVDFFGGEFPFGFFVGLKGEEEGVFEAFALWCVWSVFEFADGFLGAFGFGDAGDGVGEGGEGWEVVVGGEFVEGVLVALPFEGEFEDGGWGVVHVAEG